MHDRDTWYTTSHQLPPVGLLAQVCKAAASDAAGHAERAAESATAAADASLRAERCLGDAEVSAHAEVRGYILEVLFALNVGSIASV